MKPVNPIPSPAAQLPPVGVCSPLVVDILIAVLPTVPVDRLPEVASALAEAARFIRADLYRGGRP